MNLALGSTGDAVKLLQTLLIEAKYSIGPSGVDGKFGPYTQAAVESFQADHGLAADGVVGPETAAALGLDLSTGGLAAAAAQAATGDSGATAGSSKTSRYVWYGTAAAAAYFLKPWRWLGFGK